MSRAESWELVPNGACVETVLGFLYRIEQVEAVVGSGGGWSGGRIRKTDTNIDFLRNDVG